MGLETKPDDNALARHLAGQGALDAGTLARCLAEAEDLRRQGQAATLASVLIRRQLVDPRLLASGTRAPPPRRRPRLIAHRESGDTIGAFTIERELGRGGMGAVYKGHSAAGHPVAIKVMLHPRKGAKQKERFRRECAALAALDHPGIVKLLHADTEQDLPSMVLEFVDGRDLEGALRDGDLSLEQKLGILESVCRAVHYAHGKGILHRDLKPANVLLDGDNRPKVTDFGLARDLTRHTRLTKTGASLGTPGYMAPEQVQGKKDITLHCDVFSLGVILYEAITGSKPFEGGSPIMILAQIVRATPEPPSKLTAEADPRHDAVCLKALQKAPSDRFASALDLAEAIAGLRETESQASAAWRRLRPALVGVLVLGALAGGAYGWSVRQPGPLNAQEVRERSGSIHEEAWTLLTATTPLKDDGGQVATLRERLTALRARCADATQLEKASRRLTALDGLLALAQDDVQKAQRAVDALSGAKPSPELRTLRGAVSAVTQDGDAHEAARSISSGLARGMRRPELRGWRAIARQRAGLGSRTDAQEALEDLEAVEAAHGGALEPRYLPIRIRALIALGKLDEARSHLDTLSPPPVDLRWDVALADAERRVAEHPAQVLALLRALPPQSPLDPRRRELAGMAYRPAELLFVGEGATRDLTPADRERVIDLLRLGRHLWPEDPVPAGLTAELLRRSQGRAGSVGDAELGVPLADLTPDNLEVQTQIGLLAQRADHQRDKRGCLRALRRAIALQPEPAKRLDLERALVTVLAYINNRFEHVVDEGECEELLRVSTEILDRFAPDDSDYAKILASRAVALRRLGDMGGAWRDINDALERNGSTGSFRYTRMRIALTLGKLDQAFEDAVFYANVGESSQRNNAAVVVVWEESRKRDRDDLAVGPLQTLLANRPELVGWWVRLANLHLRLGDRDQAQRCVSKALEWTRSTTEQVYRDTQFSVNGVPQQEFFSELEIAFASFTPTQSGLITFTSFTDAMCRGNTSGAFNVAVNPQPVETITANICESESVVVNGQEYNFPGEYNIVIEGGASNGCDSIVDLTLNVFDEEFTSIVTRICTGDSIVVGTQVYTESGSYIDTLSTVNGCDSVVSLNLEVVNQIVDIRNQVVCAGNSVVFGDEILTESGTYFDTIPVTQSCDSIIVLNLNVLTNMVLTQTVIVPDTGQSSGSISIVVGGSIPPYTFLWSTGDTTQNVENLETDEYSVTVTDFVGCSAVFDFFVVSGIHDPIEGVDAFSLFPNPGNDLGNISLLLETSSQLKNQLELSILDMQGRAVVEKYALDARTGRNIIRLPGVELAAGTYLVALTESTTGRSMVRRLLIQ